MALGSVAEESVSAGPAPVREASRKRGGFTLTEVIAVIAIIAILATVVVAVGRYALKRARIGKTDATFGKLVLGIGLYKEDFGLYIPESVDTKNGESLETVFRNAHYPELSLRWPAGFVDALGKQRSAPSVRDYDKPSEILFFFLQEMYDAMNFNSTSRGQNKSLLASLPRKKAYVEFKGKELADTDGDGLPEIVDGWGRPFLYVAKDRLKGDSRVNVEPHQGKNEESFSLYSFGPDKLGYYEGKERMERDYPVGDLTLDGKSDSADENEMNKRIKEFGEGEGVSEEKARELVNADNVVNWERRN
jgi:prepilin-type N-terminal cleavage/methylation domain-containing protein